MLTFTASFLLLLVITVLPITLINLWWETECVRAVALPNAETYRIALVLVTGALCLLFGLGLLDISLS